MHLVIPSYAYRIFLRLHYKYRSTNNEVAKNAVRWLMYPNHVVKGHVAEFGYITCRTKAHAVFCLSN